MASVTCFPPERGGDVLKAKGPGCPVLMYKRRTQPSGLKSETNVEVP